jgi:23S rRNA (pseudouridine1915-N3)-methyltransferase
LLSHSGKENEEAIKTESKTILGKISSSDYVIVLDERGKLIDNYELSNKLSVNKNIIIIIGGPYGVSQEIRDRANFVWSLGKLVYPYEIVRLILTEQIYRSQMINLNHPYHHK